MRYQTELRPLEVAPAASLFCQFVFVSAGTSKGWREVDNEEKGRKRKPHYRHQRCGICETPVAKHFPYQHEGKEMTKQILTATILLLSLFSYIAAQSRTDGFKDANPRQTLENLGQIGLTVKYGQVDGLETAMQPAVLQKLRDRALNRLSQGKVPLLQATDEAAVVARPRLVFTVTLRKPTDPPPALGIDSKLFQRVRLWRDPAQEVELPTWSMSVVGPKVDSEMLLALFDKQLDAFVREYRAANPNPPLVESLATEPQLKDTVSALQGLTGIDLMVSLRFIQFAEPRFQALADPLQREAENKLKQAGIPLLRYAPETARAGYPLLNVVVTLDQNGASYAPGIDVSSQFWQRVQPIREKQKYTYLPTWESHANDGPAITEETLRKIVNSQLDQFIEAYRRANPTLPSQPTAKTQ